VCTTIRVAGWFWRTLADHPERVHPVHAQVDQDHVRGVAAHGGDGLVGVAGLGHDGHAGVLEQPPDRRPHDREVVHDEDVRAAGTWPGWDE
jgi:hypothetical protein